MEQLCEKIMGGGTSNFRETQPISHQTNTNFVTNCLADDFANQLTYLFMSKQFLLPNHPCWVILMPTFSNISIEL